ncbi:ferredoxin [Clostridium sp. CAG:1193]|jgi:ferredoxin|nr:ferredoxin [Clostridium sp. CAG:1193]
MFKVDKEKCIGCGACVGTCDNVFDFDDDNLAYVKNQPNNENENLAIEAMENCPTNAIEKE